MKHLFIINPAADKARGKVQAITADIQKFFESNTHLPYDIHVTRWSRDAVGYVRRYVQSAQELVRVYAVGGTGTMFEVVNAVVGLVNVQTAFLPFGACNSFLRYFGEANVHLFSSLRSLVFAKTIPIDAIRCGHNYGICAITIGYEAASKRDGDALKETTRLPLGLVYTLSTVLNGFKHAKLTERYTLLLDDKILDGEYLSLQIANQPCYGQLFYPAIDAHPNDGIFDVYLLKDASSLRLMPVMSDYARGHYRRYPDQIRHYTGTTLQISAPQVMCISLDGEVFYETAVECKIQPYAIDFACPESIDIKKLPRFYKP